MVEADAVGDDALQFRDNGSAENRRDESSGAVARERAEPEITYGLRQPRAAPTWCARWDVRRACAAGLRS